MVRILLVSLHMSISCLGHERAMRQCSHLLVIDAFELHVAVYDLSVCAPSCSLGELTRPVSHLVELGLEIHGRHMRSH